MNNTETTLLVIRTINQIHALDNSISDWKSKPLLVISCHPTVDIELRKRKVSFVSLYDAVAAQLSADCESEVDELTKVFTGILRELWPDTPLLIEGLRPNIYIAAQDFVRSRLTIEALMQYAKPSSVWVVSNLDVPRILDVELSSDIFDAMLLHLAKKSGIHTRLIHRSAIVNLIDSAYHRIVMTRIARYMIYLLQVKRRLGRRKQQHIIIPLKTSRRRIMLLGDDFDFENQLPLVRKLRQDSKTEPIHVFLGDPYKWMRDDTYRYMAENPETWVNHGVFLRHYHTKFNPHKPSRQFQGELNKAPSGWREWLSSPYLKFQLNWMFKDAPQKALHTADLWETLFKAYKPDITIVMQDSTYDYVSKSIALKRLGIKTVLLPHSAIVNATPSASKFLSDRAFVWGEIMREELIALGIEPERISVTGVVKPMQKFVHLNPDQRQQKLENIGLSANRKTIVTVTSGSFERWMRPYVDVKKHLASIEAIISYCMQQPDIQLIIKTHPRRDYPAIYDEMIARLGKGEEQRKKIKVIVKANLFDILALADTVVSPNTHTTASLEALVAEQPIVYISSARVYDKGFSWVKYGGCLVIDNAEDIPRMLDAVMRDDKLRRKLIEEGRQLLKKYYATEGDEAVSRVVELLQK